MYILMRSFKVVPKIMKQLFAAFHVYSPLFVLVKWETPYSLCFVVHELFDDVMSGLVCSGTKVFGFYSDFSYSFLWELLYVY